jgi:glycosyltransferase involved in cell wall biosynthesis
MKISVIIPVYNTARYLAECLDSVAAQDFDDWECLIVDDGSSDGSGAICDEYAAGDARFRVFHTANSGVSAARNLGIGHARGSFLAFIDSDDWVERGYLSGLYRAAGDSGAELALCGMRLVRDTGVEVNLPEPGVFSPGGGNSDRFVELNRKFLLYGPCVKLYRSDMVRGKNIRFPTDINYGEDLMFNFDYLEHVRTIAAVGAPLYNYRMVSAGTLSTSPTSRDFATNYGQWKIIRSFFERKGIRGESAAGFLSARLWGIAYDTAMSRKMSIKELGAAFSPGFLDDLGSFDNPSVAVPGWLRGVIRARCLPAIWLVQRRP